MSTLITCLIVGVAAYTDARQGKVYNWLTYPAIAIGLLYHSVSLDGVGLSASAVGCFGAGGLFFLFYLYRLANGGDVKLIAAVGAWCGTPLIWTCIIASCFTGAVMALFQLLLARQMGAALKSVGWSAASIFMPSVQAYSARTGVMVPFGVAVLLGTLFGLAYGPL